MRIVTEATTLLADEAAYQQMAGVANLYGDGHAAKRIVARIGDFFRP